MILCDIIVLVIKVKKNIFILLFLILCVCGCEKKVQYTDFKHYDLKGYDITNKYSLVDDNNYKHEYVITDITPEYSEEIINGLFYKVSENDYILLDEIKSCNSLEAFKSKNQNYFYNDKLYVNRCSGGVVLEYTLSGSKTSKKDLLSELDSKWMLISISNVDDDYIYYNGRASISGTTEIVKCSKANNKCELLND